MRNRRRWKSQGAKKMVRHEGGAVIAIAARRAQEVRTQRCALKPLKPAAAELEAALGPCGAIRMSTSRRPWKKKLCNEHASRVEGGY